MNCFIRNFSKLSHFNYDQHGRDWSVKRGKEQSPISLFKNKSIKSKAPTLSFLNYNKTLCGPLKLINNGHTVTMPIPAVIDGDQPAVCGCKLKCVYKAIDLHFHWGSPKSKGSEHSIDSSRFDVELHILHQNTAYVSRKDALCAPDGFVVLAIMLKLVSGPELNTPLLNKVCSELNLIRDFNKISTFESDFTLRDILLGIERQEFFAYKGSLTTPPCAESVDWFVFPKPVYISKHFLKKFWLLKDVHGNPLLNNYRELQNLNNRMVYYRNKKKHVK